jgi:hypothetical protein
LYVIKIFSLFLTFFTSQSEVDFGITLVLYSFPNIIRQIKSRRKRWAEHVAHMREERNVYKVLMGKPEGKRPHGRPRHSGRMRS